MATPTPGAIQAQDPVYAKGSSVPTGYTQTGDGVYKLNQGASQAQDPVFAAGSAVPAGYTQTGNGIYRLNGTSPSSPVSVVSSSQAGSSLTGTVLPAMANAQNDIAGQNAKRQAEEMATKAAADAKTQASSQPKPPSTPADDAATAIANTPDAGFRFAYSKADGTRTQVPLSQAVPTGFLDSDPNSAVPSNSVSNGTGLTFGQLPDGSYARYDASGKYVGPSSQQEMDNAKATQDILAKLNQATLGSYPLKPAQQAMIDATKAQFQQLIDEQAKANANLTGGVTVAQNLYGIGTTVMGLGNVAQSVTDGINAIASIQTKLASTVAQMTEAFDKDNLSDLKDAYSAYSGAQKELQDNVQKVHDDMVAAARDARDYNFNVQKEKYAKEKDQRDYDERVKEYLQNYSLDEKKYNLSVDAAKLDKQRLGLEQAKYSHQLDMDAATGVGSLDDKGLEMLARGYLTSGTLPSVGYGKAAITMRNAIINRAVALSGGADDVNPALNKASYEANKAVLKQQSQNYAVADTAYRIFDKNGDLALKLADGLNKSNSPMINQLTNKVVNQSTGKGNLDSFRAVVTSLQSEYATLINVKGGGGGQVTEGDKQKAEKAIPMDISPSRLKEVLTNLKSEGSNVLSERKQTIEQLNKNISANAGAYNSKTQPTKVTLQDYYQSNPSLQPKLDKAITDHPEWSDEDIMQIINH